MNQLLSRLAGIFTKSNANTLPTSHEAVDKLIQQGNSLEDKGNPTAALVKFKQAIEIAPAYPRAHLNLGNALLATGQAEKAIFAYREAIRLDPTYAYAYFNLGNAFQQINDPEEAISAYREALRHSPSLPGGHYSLGRLLMEQNRPEDAVPTLEEALKQEPDSKQVKWLLARSYNLTANLITQETGGEADLSRAEFLCREAIRLDATYPETRHTLGTILERQGDLVEAESSYNDAIALKPTFALAHYSLGFLLERQGKQRDANSCYRQAIALDPNMAHAHAKLGDMLALDGNLKEAENCYLKALSLAPELAEVDIRMGELKTQQEKPNDALAYFQRALTKKPGNVAALRWLGVSYLNMGRHQEAADLIRKAEALEAWAPDAQSCMLFTLTCSSDISTKELVDRHFAFGRYCRDRVCPQEKHSNSSDLERRLRIGYVSGDFVNHVVAGFFEPLLECHDRNQFEVFCYHNNFKSDAVTERVKIKSDHWRDIARMDDDAAAALVQDDRIDILVDLAGHSFLNRLMLFARKPAPVQATWLGYLGTTGLSTIDYRICDAYTDPPGLTENQHSEQLARLPHSQWCYRPPIELPETSAPPFLRNGYLTLGSFNSVRKLNSMTIGLWAEILHALPLARLLIAPVSDDGTTKHLLHQFESFDIKADRLMFRGRQKANDYFASYREVDIALDPFPYNGGTTTLDALLMGVPVVTLAGERSISRGGVSILSNLGLTELIAYTPENYVHIVQKLAGDRARLTLLHETLRSRMQQSPLMDMGHFAQDMEKLYLQMWRQWVCQQEIA